MKKYLSYIVTIVVWLAAFYIYLPAVNLKSQDFWWFMAFMAVSGLVINAGRIIRGIDLRNLRYSFSAGTKGVKIIMRAALVFILVYLAGAAASLPVFRAKDYSSLMRVENGTFEDDIEEADFSSIPILDSASAAILAERKMGTMSDMVSQFEVSSSSSQINYNGKPYRVTPLRYGSIIKWIANRSEGIPAYIIIDMSTQNAELIKLDEGIKISPSEYFGRDLMRYIRFRYPTAMFRGTYFEIDDDGTPYWICPVEDHTIGLFGGTDIKGAVVLNAVTGEHIYYAVEDIPQWIDRVFDAELLMEQYDYYGTLSNGYINSLFAQKNCFRTTEGYNYIALDDDVWVYTGVTSVSGDQSNVGFVLMNQRTKEANYYEIAGAEEFSAMSSAEGQVQHLGYTATFPLLLNVGGEPTYFIALKDGAGLVKKYAMVNIQKYQIVAIGDTVSQCVSAYEELMENNGISIEENAEKLSLSGTVSSVRDIVIDGNTYIYITVDGSDDFYRAKAADHPDILRKSVGSGIDLEYAENGEKGVYDITKVS